MGEASPTSAASPTTDFCPIDPREWPGRHRSDARPHWFEFEYSSPAAGRAVTSRGAHQLSAADTGPSEPEHPVRAPRRGDRRTCGRSATRAKAAGAQAGPHPYSGRRPAEAARVVARPAEIITWLAAGSLAGRRSNLAGCIRPDTPGCSNPRQSCRSHSRHRSSLAETRKAA